MNKTIHTWNIFELVLLIQAEEGHSISAYARRLDTTYPVALDYIEILEKGKAIKRDITKRNHKIYLTKKGKELALNYIHLRNFMKSVRKLD